MDALLGVDQLHGDVVLSRVDVVDAVGRKMNDNSCSYHRVGKIGLDRKQREINNETNKIKNK